AGCRSASEVLPAGGGYRHPFAGVILTHKTRTAGGIGGGNGREPALDPRSAQPCSPRSSWRSLLRQPAPFNGRSTIAVHARHRMTAVSDSRTMAQPPGPLGRRSSAPALYGHSL